MNLQNAYDRDTYLEFLRTFVPGFKQDIRDVIAEKLQVTSEAYFLGESEDLDLSVFEITHSSSADARVSLSMDGFKLMKTSATYRALIVYRSENSEDWRFSLMTATPDLDEKGKVVRKLSNPRRFSFFLGPNAKINTPKRFLIKEGPVSDFADLQNRFSLEVVNKEFYKQISEKFTQLVGGTLGTGKKQKTYEPLIKLPSQSEKSQANMEFGVRLIGRIIFCWFLREKKSKNDLSLMPKQLLSYEALSKHSNYYHSVLEPIFFEVLNKEHRSRREEFSGDPYSLIPYLNGGLFSPHEDDYYKRPNGEQSIYHNTLVIPDEWMKELFEILETYNFTIDENTSFDEELSIDPEMLGRIFENLLAEINPETGESARKSTGSYYTPRVIVDYMVDESILLYLQEHTKIPEEKLRAVISYDLSDNEEHPLAEDEKKQVVETLGKLKLLDPACGSGAFPIGALQKIVFILQQVDPDGKLWLHKQLEKAHPEFRRDIEKRYSNLELDFLRKLGVIRECIFGVDIQPIATEIARLRCFLTLIVDERIDDEVENRGIKPLPNLDFKFVTANSLIDLPKIEDSLEQTQMFDDREKIEDLKSVRDQYFNAYGIEREQLKTEFVTAQKKLIDQLVEEHGYIGVTKAELTQKLTNWEPFSHKSSGWFDPEWMFGISTGFDIVIANPPYIGEVGHKELFRSIRQHGLSKYYQRKMDVFYFFVHLAIKLGKKESLSAFITTNYYITAQGATNLRTTLKEETCITHLINFNELKIFQSATGQHNMITIFQKGKNFQSLAFSCSTRRAGIVSEDILSAILSGKDDMTSFNNLSQDQIFEGNENYIRIEGVNNNSSLDRIAAKMNFGSSKLGSITTINMGVQSGADILGKKLFERALENGYVNFDYLRDNDISIGSKIYILDSQTVGLFPRKEVQDLVKPFIKNSDISSYHVSLSGNQFYLYVDSEIDINAYPEAKKHLSRFRQIMKAREQVNDSDKSWYWIRGSKRKFLVDTGNHIVCPYRSKTNSFGLTNGNIIGATDIYYITSPVYPNELEYILGILNSKLTYFWLYNKGKRKGDVLELCKEFLSEIPIINAPELDRRSIVSKVNRILSITQSIEYLDDSGKQSKVSEYMQELDQLIYCLYRLTPEEIEIVESFGK